jgi:hypothetical protein
MRNRIIRLIYPVGIVIIVVLIIPILYQPNLSALAKGFTVLVNIVAGGLLLKVLKQRLENTEDDYYSKNINQ